MWRNLWFSSVNGRKAWEQWVFTRSQQISIFLQDFRWGNSGENNPGPLWSVLRECCEYLTLRRLGMSPFPNWSVRMKSYPGSQTPTSSKRSERAYPNPHLRREKGFLFPGEISGVPERQESCKEQNCILFDFFLLTFFCFFFTWGGVWFPWSGNLAWIKSR